MLACGPLAKRSSGYVSLLCLLSRSEVMAWLEVLSISDTECSRSSLRFLLMSEENRQHRHLTLLFCPFMASRLTLCFMFRAIKHNVDITVKHLPMETGCFAAVCAFAEPCVYMQSPSQTQTPDWTNISAWYCRSQCTHSQFIEPEGWTSIQGDYSLALPLFLPFLREHRRQTGPRPCALPSPGRGNKLIQSRLR